jgi:uncharacterized membrane protein YidH (DUF202 family)
MTRSRSTVIAWKRTHIAVAGMCITIAMYGPKIHRGKCSATARCHPVHGINNPVKAKPLAGTVLQEWPILISTNR